MATSALYHTSHISLKTSRTRKENRSVQCGQTITTKLVITVRNTKILSNINTIKNIFVKNIVRIYIEFVNLSCSKQ